MSKELDKEGVDGVSAYISRRLLYMGASTVSNVATERSSIVVFHLLRAQCVLHAVNKAFFTYINKGIAAETDLNSPRPAKTVALCPDLRPNSSGTSEASLDPCGGGIDSTQQRQRQGQTTASLRPQTPPPPRRDEGQSDQTLLQRDEAEVLACPSQMVHQSWTLPHSTSLYYCASSECLRISTFSPSRYLLYEPVLPQNLKKAIVRRMSKKVALEPAVAAVLAFEEAKKVVPSMQNGGADTKAPAKTGSAVGNVGAKKSPGRQISSKVGWVAAKPEEKKVENTTPPVFNYIPSPELLTTMITRAADGKT